MEVSVIRAKGFRHGGGNRICAAGGERFSALQPGIVPCMLHIASVREIYTCYEENRNTFAPAESDHICAPGHGFRSTGDKERRRGVDESVLHVNDK